MPTPLDLMLALVVGLIWPLHQNLIAWPQFLRKLRSGTPGARVKGYWETITHLWVLSATVLIAWAVQGRALPALGLGWGSGWMAWAMAGVAVAGAVGMALQTRGVAASRETRALVRARIAPVRDVLPHDRRELRVFHLVSISAGVCEELLFRGYVIWVASAYAGPWVGALVTAVLFGLGHLYQGASGVLQTGVIGLIMSAVVAASGSLWPAMLLHASIDWGSGDAGHLAIETEAADAAAAAGAAAGASSAAAG